MKIKIKKINNLLNSILSKSTIAITLAPFGIFIKEKYFYDLKIINHEKIHWIQQLEMLIIFFYVWYIIEWIIRLFINGKLSYIKISLEREAYEKEDDINYISIRKHFAWLKYFKSR